ncbi:MAG: hypothetical protein ACT4PN_05815 [Nitrospiraceae bacterium]
MIEIDRKASGMFGKARSKHVRQYSGHDCGPKHIIQAVKAAVNKAKIYVVEKVVDILHGHLEVLQAEAIG